ncbi:hypothetical protein N7461_008429 [Penicillium sp. DV-2018c]|nr:hypothetical protein N7461_008429 [Penicillium sp. DV-2018c]
MAEPNVGPLDGGDSSASAQKPQSSPDSPKTQLCSVSDPTTDGQVVAKSGTVDPVQMGSEGHKADSTGAVVQATEATEVTVVHTGPTEQRPNYPCRSVAAILDDYESALSAGVDETLAQHALKIELGGALQEDFTWRHLDVVKDGEVPEGTILDDDGKEHHNDSFVPNIVSNIIQQRRQVTYSFFKRKVSVD